ncbi:MAG: prohibitin family protein [Candidatus Rokubacteria bacterium]|nr:prohibitin family protein [Candidatus Rokubacteria bacterium]
MSLLLFGLALGALLLFVSFAIPRAAPHLGDRKAIEATQARIWLRIAGGLVIVLGVVLGAFRVVPGGTVGVQILFGKIDDRALSEGLSAINPLKEVRLMSVRTLEMFEHADVPSKEGLTVGLEVSALYHLESKAAPGVFRTLGERYATVFILPQFRSVIRGATVNHEAKDLYTSGREVIAQQIYDELHKMLGERGIILEKVLLRRIVLPRMVEEAINTKLAAEQEAERMRFVLLKERQEADRKRVEASGIADFQRIVSQGISEPLLKWKAIEVAHEISKSPNTKVVILGDKSGLPIILGDR